MSAWVYDTETTLVADGSGRWSTELTAGWNIGENPNGGYAIGACLRAMQQLTDRPDPMSITAHFLRPASGGERGEVEGSLVRQGRRASTATAVLGQGGTERIRLIGAFTDLASHRSGWDGAPTLASDPVDLPPPDECRSRAKLEQGVELPILSRLDVRIDPVLAEPGAGGRAEIAGWIRFADGRPPDSLILPLFADAFPPSLYSLVGRVGWVPTIELTVHVLRRPAPGWIRARFVTQHLTGDLLVEDGELWDESGALVANSRQLGLLLG